MKKLSINDVEHVCLLAKLTLTKEEKRKFQKQLAEVLGYVGILNKAVTKKTEPTNQVTGLKNIVREDRIGESLAQKATLSGTKQVCKGMFKVGAIFEEQ